MGYRDDAISVKHYMEELNYDYPEPDLKSLQTEQNARLKSLSDYCQNADNKKWRSNNMFYLAKLNLTLCLQPKAASTDLTRLLAEMIGLDPMDNDFQRIKSCDDQNESCLIKITESNREQLLSKTNNAVVFVREPMERLVAGLLKLVKNSIRLGAVVQPLYGVGRPKIDLLFPQNARFFPKRMENNKQKVYLWNLDPLAYSINSRNTPIAYNSNLKTLKAERAC